MEQKPVVPVVDVTDRVDHHALYLLRFGQSHGWGVDADRWKTEGDDGCLAVGWKVVGVDDVVTVGRRTDEGRWEETGERNGVREGETLDRRNLRWMVMCLRCTSSVEIEGTTE